MMSPRDGTAGLGTPRLGIRPSSEHRHASITSIVRSSSSSTSSERYDTPRALVGTMAISKVLDALLLLASKPAKWEVTFNSEEMIVGCQLDSLLDAFIAPSVEL